MEIVDIMEQTDRQPARTRRVNGLLLVAVLASLLGLPVIVGAKTTEPSLPPPEYRAAVNSQLGPAPDREAVSALIGTQPVKCLDASSDAQLCEWRLFDQTRGWQSLARAIKTRSRIVLLCELPRDGSRRAADACSAHPQASNKGQFSLGPGRKSSTRVNPRKLRAQYQELAEGWVERAKTFTQLSRLMGALPDACWDNSAEEQTCHWATNNRIYGHGTLVTWIQVSQGKRVRLTCLLARSGAPRGSSSCSAAIGR